MYLRRHLDSLVHMRIYHAHPQNCLKSLFNSQTSPLVLSPVNDLFGYVCHQRSNHCQQIKSVCRALHTKIIYDGQQECYLNCKINGNNSDQSAQKIKYITATDMYVAMHAVQTILDVQGKLCICMHRATAFFAPCIIQVNANMKFKKNGLSITKRQDHKININ